MMNHATVLKPEEGDYSQLHAAYMATLVKLADVEAERDAVAKDRERVIKEKEEAEKQAKTYEGMYIYEKSRRDRLEGFREAIAMVFCDKKGVSL